MYGEDVAGEDAPCLLSLEPPTCPPQLSMFREGQAEWYEIRVTRHERQEREEECSQALVLASSHQQGDGGACM